MNSLRIGLMSAALVAGLATASAQTVAADSVMQHVNGKRLSVGGYGEVAMSRNFYSDHVSRYSLAECLLRNEELNSIYESYSGLFDRLITLIPLTMKFAKGFC